jgi:hypothetical protein
MLTDMLPVDTLSRSFTLKHTLSDSDGHDKLNVFITARMVRHLDVGIVEVVDFKATSTVSDSTDSTTPSEVWWMIPCLSTVLTLVTVVLLGLQHTVVSGYLLMGVFYLNMLVMLYTQGQHTVLLVALLSVSLVVLVMVVLVRMSIATVLLNLVATYWCLATLSA